MKYDPSRLVLLTPEITLRAYTLGLFPMAQSRNDEQIFWLDPPRRGIIIPQSFHTPRRLRRTMRATAYRIRYNHQFDEVVAHCAQQTAHRKDTWLNRPIMHLHHQLHKQGYAHSIECYHEDKLVGGLYGIALGAVFFGESMFSRKTDASKIALCHLVQRLIEKRFRLLDTQFISEHLKQFGAQEIPRDNYRLLLQAALKGPHRLFDDSRPQQPALTLTLP
ncbi:MAG: leucyl/phenylalanyl-tRNA--protein transferase [Alphaproteobacteria bacterium GM202ARS2]|nr:leucyl/phenylalanyl-tRNA--protein transferase [Alphaproteobacteria bacterium GM202ARS2]